MSSNAKRKTAKQAKAIISARQMKYDWALNLYRSGFIKAELLHTLKGIVSCDKLIKPTLEQINKARTKSVKEWGHDNWVTIRSVQRHIKKLEHLGLITVTRETDGWYSRNEYVVNCPKYELVNSPQDTASYSLSSFSLKRERRAASFQGLAASTRRNAAQAKDWAQSHVAKMEGTELLGEALVALEGQGLVKPKRGSLTDRLFILALEDFNVFLSAKLLELEQKRALL